MSSVSLSGYSVLACSVSLPAWGIGWAEVELEESEQLSGSVVLSLPGLDLACFVMSGGPWQGRARYRLALGAGQWGATVAGKSYANDLGVKLATVLADVATACGETLSLDGVSGTLGPQWVRDAGPAARTLSLVAPMAWYVDTDGTTRLGARAASVVGTELTITDRDPAGGWLEVACEDASELLPGATVDGLEAVDVVHSLRDGKLRTRLYAGHGTVARARGALARLVDGLTASLRYRGVWSYRVVSQTGERLYLQPERASTGMPDLQSVRTRYAPGVKAEHAIGSMVLVAFVDGSPSRPVVVGGDDPDSPGFAPDELTLVGTDDALVSGGGPELGRCLRYGDGHLCAFTGASVPLTATPGVPLSASRVFP